MKVILDTQVLLWALIEPGRLPAASQAMIESAGNDVLFSAASIWEIAIKQSLGKLSAPDDLPETILHEGFSYLPVGAAHAWYVRKLPMHHRDPFDRLLAAQALTERMPVVTADTRFLDYAVETRW